MNENLTVFLALCWVASVLFAVWTGHWITSNPFKQTGGAVISCSYEFPALPGSLLEDKDDDR